MMIPLPGATRFSQVTRESVLLPSALTGLIEEIEKQNAAHPELVRVFFGGELRVVGAIKHIVVADMLA